MIKKKIYISGRPRMGTNNFRGLLASQLTNKKRKKK